MVDAPEPADPGRSDATDQGDDELPPMLPSRGSYLLAFAATVLAGVLGGIIGFGIVDVTSDSDVAIFFGALVGALVGAIGVGVVAVLVLRAMAEWQRRPRDAAPPVRRRS